MAILGNPFVANIKKPLSKDEMIQALRVDIAGELEAVISYEAHAMSVADENVKKVLMHISNEEKQHVGELQQLLYMLNPQEEQYVEKGKQAVKQQQSQGFSQPMQ